MMNQHIILSSGNGEKDKKIFAGDRKITSGATMEITIDKYLDIRFEHMEQTITDIKESFKDIRIEIKEQNKKIDLLKYWILGSFLGLATLFFTVVGYYTLTLQNEFNHHQASIQTEIQAFQGQMQTFSEYVKTLSESRTPQAPPLPQHRTK